MEELLHVWGKNSWKINQAEKPSWQPEDKKPSVKGTPSMETSQGTWSNYDSCRLITILTHAWVRKFRLQNLCWGIKCPSRTNTVWNICASDDANFMAHELTPSWIGGQQSQWRLIPPVATIISTLYGFEFHIQDIPFCNIVLLTKISCSPSKYDYFGMQFFHCIHNISWNNLKIRDL